MRRTLLLCAFMMLSVFVFGQDSKGGIPPSFEFGIIQKNVDIQVLPAPDLTYILAEREKMPKDGTIDEIGVSVGADISLDNSGTWTELPDGGRMWQVEVSCEGALALGMYFNKFHLAPGTRMYMYNEAGNQILGAFTSDNNDESGMFSTEMIQGDKVIIEYFEPARLAGKSEFRINEVAYFYKDVHFGRSLKDFGQAESCEVNINCSPVGTNWQDEKRGVCRLLVKTGSQYGWCTGTLVNNTNNDCTPYVLSAYHCYEGASAADLNQWIFYFNYEAAACTNPSTEPSSNTKTGATLKASGNISGGSDMLLVQLNSAIATNFNAYYCGWSRNTTVTGPGVGIHHPAGDIKKISTYSTVTSSTYSGAASGAHWRLSWVSNSNGWGVTEGGSSGSAIFDANSRIVGTLTGGSSYCSAQTSPDYYGKMSYHWESNGTTNATKLRPWLDPAGTNPTTHDGQYCGAATLNAAFTANITTVAVGGTVTFTNQSTGSPTSYSWSFTGGTPSTATGAGPHTITYNTAGTYTVALTVSNGTTSDTETKTSYITVTSGTVPSCDTLNYPLAGTATLYGAQTGGYLSGNNGYGDEAKANIVSAYTPYTKVTGAYFSIAVATDAGSTSNITFSVWNSNGTAGAPNTVLGSATVPLSTIMSNVSAQTATYVDFNPDITVSANYYIGVVLPTVAGDTIALVTNTDGDTNPGTAWERWDGGTWYAYSDASGWGMNLAHAIYPIMCQTTSSTVNGLDVYAGIYPNPAKNELNVALVGATGQTTIIRIVDMFGKVCREMEVVPASDEPIRLDIANLPSGMYMVSVVYGETNFMEKINILK